MNISVSYSTAVLHGLLKHLASDVTYFSKDRRNRTASSSPCKCVYKLFHVQCECHLGSHVVPEGKDFIQCIHHSLQEHKCSTYFVIIVKILVFQGDCLKRIQQLTVVIQEISLLTQQ